MKLSQHLIRIVRVVRAIGPTQAIKFLLFLNRREGRFKFRTRFSERPVTLRGKSSDAYVFEQLIICEQYKPFCVKPPVTIIDAGANIGLAALYWSHRFPDAKIVCIEPDSANFEILLANTQHLPNVEAIKAGLWSRETKLKVLYPLAEKYAIQLVEDAEDGEIATISIESIMQRQRWHEIDVLKCDIEGSEIQLLAPEARGWIKKTNIVIIELHQSWEPDCARLLFEAFSSVRFHLSWKGENLVIRKHDGNEELNKEC